MGSRNARSVTDFEGDCEKGCKSAPPAGGSRAGAKNLVDRDDIDRNAQPVVDVKMVVHGEIRSGQNARNLASSCNSRHCPRPGALQTDGLRD